MSSKPITTFNAIGVLELACAAHRYNGGYIREEEIILSVDGKTTDTKHPNKQLMRFSLGEEPPQSYAYDSDPFFLHINDADRQLAADIKKHFRKLVFAAVLNDNEFYTALNIMFTNNEVPLSKFGYFAALPSVYTREYADAQFKKRIIDLNRGHLGNTGDKLLDKDTEILEIFRSKNYDAWNVTAIIDNTLVSWMGSSQVNPGPCVLIKATIKGFSDHYKYHIPVTRLNYVKVFQ